MYFKTSKVFKFFGRFRIGARMHIRPWARSWLNRALRVLGSKMAGSESPVVGCYQFTMGVVSEGNVLLLTKAYQNIFEYKSSLND